jgi:hypothetical protein
MDFNPKIFLGVQGDLAVIYKQQKYQRMLEKNRAEKRRGKERRNLEKIISLNINVKEGQREDDSALQN